MSDGGSLSPRFFRLTLVNIFSNVTVPLAGLADTAMLGHLPNIRFLGGVALATLIFDTVVWSMSFLRMGTTGLVAQTHGAGREAEGVRVLRRALLVAVTGGTLLVLLQWPLRELSFWILAGEPGVEAAGRDYFNWRIWGAPATLANLALVGWLLGRQQSQNVLWMTIVANVVNIGLNYLFIMRLGFAAAGAGAATMIAQWSMLAVGAALYFRQVPRTPWRRSEILHRGELTQVFRLNRDLVIRTLLLTGCLAGFTQASALLGTVILAANAVLMRVFYLAAYSIDGAALAAESLGGALQGSGDREGLRRLFKLSLGTGLVYAALFVLVFVGGSDLWLRLLTSHRDVVMTAQYYSPWLIPVLLFGALAFIYDGLFIGLTLGRTLRNAMVVSVLVAFVPLAVYGALAGSNNILWAAMAAFMIVRALTLGWASRALTSPRPA